MIELKYLQRLLFEVYKDDFDQNNQYIGKLDQEMKKRVIQNSFLDISNILAEETTCQGVYHIEKQKLKHQLINKDCQTNKKQNPDAIKLLYIPISKISRSGSQVFSRGVQSEAHKITLHKNNISAAQSPPLNKRFQRNSEKSFEYCRQPSKLYFKHKGQDGQRPVAQQKYIFNNVNAERLRSQHQNYKVQNQKLKLLLIQKTAKIQEYNALFEESETKCKQFDQKLTERENNCQRLQQGLIARNKMISKLQQSNKNLEKKLGDIKKGKISNQDVEWNEKVNKIYERLKYKEIEVHMLKKQLFDKQNMEKKLIFLLRENNYLKNRIKYFIRSKGNFCTQGSNSSLSLSALSFQPQTVQLQNVIQKAAL